MTGYRIPFTRVHLTGREIEYVRQVLENNHLAGDGVFTARCSRWLEKAVGCPKALLTHSGTAALEMAAILSRVGPGDEVIMPSFTFVSTANAFVLRGATPVFVDIDPVMMNIDPQRVAEATSGRTRVIIPIHYAGVAADMNAIRKVATDAGAMIIEDAAQALLSSKDNRPLGSFGAMATLSFHETKNITSGEGGALLINDPTLIERAEIVREKGTDRSRFYRGETDKYTWMDIGSSYLPAELTAAFLYAQLEAAEKITESRKAVWQRYSRALEPLEAGGRLSRQQQIGNAHLYFILLPSPGDRIRLADQLKSSGISAVFHYIPLHNSPAGKRFGRAAGELPVTEDVAQRLLRLPIWPDMTNEDVDYVVNAIYKSMGQRYAESEVRSM